MNLRVSTGPHILSSNSTQKIMLSVLIALLPTSIAGIYVFGYKAALVLAVSMLSALITEAVWCRLANKKQMISDMSALVTGLILGLNLPANAPLWLPVLGSIFAVALVKQLFGGLGHNFLNPAMFARAVLLASWPAHMTSYVLPQRTILNSVAEIGVDVVTKATPLRLGSIPYMDLFLGNISGTIGEVCKLAILIGFLYLIITRVISFEIPVFFVGTVALLSFILGKDPLYAVLSGGVLFGAVFMATDYVTNPTRKLGQIIFAFGCGIIVVVIRLYGNYPEGVTYAILFMNCLTPLIDRLVKTRVYGEVRTNGKK